jgi:CheY-like chemotaxis protein
LQQAMIPTRFEIMLAEDNPADVDMVRMALAKQALPCTLHIVSDGAKAIEMLESLETDAKTPPLHLLILDMHLPKRDGNDVLRSLRSIHRYARTAVIVLSGENSPAMEQMAARQPATVYFRKPFTVDEYMKLGSVVEDLLRQTGSSE